MPFILADEFPFPEEEQQTQTAAHGYTLTTSDWEYGTVRLSGTSSGTRVASDLSGIDIASWTTASGIVSLVQEREFYATDSTGYVAIDPSAIRLPGSGLRNHIRPEPTRHILVGDTFLHLSSRQTYIVTEISPTGTSVQLTRGGTRAHGTITDLNNTSRWTYLGNSMAELSRATFDFLRHKTPQSSYRKNKLMQAFMMLS